ncbi:MAG: proline dehydrogenase family protein [Thermomicrobiales bacterium]|nr:proline dehydrogenase family protein [Thermomicrobiales bacterium]
MGAEREFSAEPDGHLPSANPFFRRAILAATNQSFVSGTVRKYGMSLGAARFVAGETFDECVPILRGLNQQGFRTNTTLLGEGVADEAKAGWVVDQYKAILDRIAEENLVCNIALKLTHLGLDLGEEIAYQNVEALVVHAASLNNFIRMDMEESARIEVTLRIYERLRAAGHENTGTVLQSMHYRTADDLTRLAPLQPNLRIVKGAYLEPASVAYQDKADVDRHYVTLTERMLTECSYTGVATHDERIIDHVINYADRQGIPRHHFEFQMLYGIRSQLQRDLLGRGYQVLIATPHGPEWYFYLMRRLAERPANVLFFAKNAIKR